MGQTVTLTMPDSSTAQATELNFKMKEEPWTELELEDGTVIRVRLDISKIYRLDQYDPMSGEPIYYFTSANLIRTQVPPVLRKHMTATASTPGQKVAGYQ